MRVGSRHFRPVYGERVKVWPVGIDTERLAPLPTDPKGFDFLVYDKRRWPDTPPGRGFLNLASLSFGGKGTHGNTCATDAIRGAA